ncbi:MAG: 4'-phosphopantetheinyl transferase superfamily protein [Deltaproteobacteria bacterium]|nr:4'-phosphopantetheinyl transferase superfamily protein [Deltaproteobacteria bacterium]
MLVGNDVVDLFDAETDLDALHQRFAERVFAGDERRTILSSADPRLALWTYWAAKESAYKVVRKIDRDAIFAPSAFAVEIEGRDGARRLRGSVRYGRRRIGLKVQQSGAWIHALATLGSPGSHADFVLSAVTRRPPRRDPSAAARAGAVRALSRELGLPLEGLRIARTRPPAVLLRGRDIGLDLSLSHHGRWTAYAAALPPAGMPG